MTTVMERIIHVLATTPGATRAAIAAAVPLARGAGARLLILVPHAFPSPLGLEQQLDFTDGVVGTYRDLVAECGGDGTVRLCLCSRAEDVSRLLPEHATIVVGGMPPRWLPTSETRLARRMAALGHRVIMVACWLVCVLLAASPAHAQDAPPVAPPMWHYGAFADVAILGASTSPGNHQFRNRGTTPHLDEPALDIAVAYIKSSATESSRIGVEFAAQAGEDAKLFGFSATAPNIGGAEFLRHLGPTNGSYLAPVGKGLTVQGGIFTSLIGYDSLYAKDNFAYTRPWGADYTPYLMLGVDASYEATDRLTLVAALVNGYFHLAHANDAPSLVGQLAYKASDRVTLKETVLAGSHQPDTAIEFWRVLSDTIVERTSRRLTTAAEYQVAAERVDAATGGDALWMSGQLVVHAAIAGPWSATVRPEFCWDRDGRWTGVPQRVVAFTAGAEYRLPVRAAQAIVRGEYRVDDSRGVAGGFFAGADNHLTPTQQLLVATLIVSFDGSVQR
jgi:hypothetical protein